MGDSGPSLLLLLSTVVLYYQACRGSNIFVSLTVLSFCRSSCVLLLDQVTFDILLKVDNVTSLETISDSRVWNWILDDRVSRSEGLFLNRKQFVKILSSYPEKLVSQDVWKKVVAQIVVKFQPLKGLLLKTERILALVTLSRSLEPSQETVLHGMSTNPTFSIRH